MQLFIVTAIIFALAMLGISLGMMFGRYRHECSCKGAARIMNKKLEEERGCLGCPENSDPRLVELDK